MWWVYLQQTMVAREKTIVRQIEMSVG